MINKFTSVAASALVLGTMATTAVNAQAASILTPKQYPTSIVLNGQTIESPSAFALNNTTYMPLFYVHEALKALGMQDTWAGAGSRQSWSITDRNISSKPNLNLIAKSGSVNIYLNGKLVEENIPHAVAIDPASKEPTSYVPIWYIQELLRALGIDNGWDGKTWTLTYLTVLQNVQDVQYGADGTLYAMLKTGIYRFENDGWHVVPGSDTLGVIRDASVHTDGTIYVIGAKNLLWDYSNGKWSKLADPISDNSQAVWSFETNTPFTFAGPADGTQTVWQLLSGKWSEIG